MSWKASAYVKEVTVAPDGRRITRSEKLLLLVLADYYNDAQGCAWPSIKRLADEAMLSVRRTQELLRSLETKGLLHTVASTLENGASGTNSYIFPELESPSTEQGGRVRKLRGEGADARGGRVRNGGNSPYIEREVKPLANASPSRPFRPTAEQRQWASGKYPRLDLELETENFLDHHLAKGSKFKDWSAAWRTWIRNAATKYAPRNNKAEMNAGGKGRPAVL